MTETQAWRAPSGGRIDRSRTIGFTFDGRRMEGHPGDTLASALVANGVRLVGRSFKYHRPRGLLSAGSEEPNGLVTLGEGPLAEPNTRATMVELHDGLVARSQNAWPSLGFDIGFVNALLAPVIPAGFYYKTFMGGPRGAWTSLYEPLIRRAAGLGRTPSGPDPDRYDKRHAHCDILVVGGGPAGLAAARAAGAGGARVILVDEHPRLGGSLMASDRVIDDLPAVAWAAAAADEIASHRETRILLGATAFGRYDGNLVMAVQTLPGESGARQRLWQIRARRVVLATGAHEQPLVFGANDLPGVMLAGAAKTYAQEFAALAGRRIVVATNNDSGDDAARALAKAGAEIALLVDSRGLPRQDDYAAVTGAVVRALGRNAVRGVEIALPGGGRRVVACDALLMSGGWQPAIHLYSQTGGRTRYDAGLGAFVAADAVAAVSLVGACAGRFALADGLTDGHRAGADAASELGFPGSSRAPRTLADPDSPRVGVGFQAPGSPKSFIDFQNDVTAADIDLAHREGFVSVEHLKRYTTSGMATDQGKLSNLNAIERMATRLGKTPGEVGTTTFRPPYTPVTFGALAGIDRGDLMDPARLTPMHDWHEAHGAVFEDVGQWKRPWYYPRDGEVMDEAVRRECRTVRSAVGLFDASTLGKIDLSGPDAARFLNRVYTNVWLKLEVGRCRYGLMCGEDGMLFDDGVTVRVGPERFLMTTTTGNAARVMGHLEDLLQTEWTDLKLHLTSVTDHWAACVVTGPRARDVLGKLSAGVDLSGEAFPHLSYREAVVAGVPARLYRISFTGELSYEVHVPAQYGQEVWGALYDAGRAFGVTAYGTETMHVLRAEKGYIIIGQETDGTVTPQDLGLEWAVASSKKDFIGKRSFGRAEMSRKDRKQLVGLTPLDGRSRLEEGAQLVAADAAGPTTGSEGHVTSSYWSVAAEGPIALALLEGGRSRHGETVLAHSARARIACQVCAPIFYDPSGDRLNA